MADMQRIKRELKYAGAVVDVYADTMKFKTAIRRYGIPFFIKRSGSCYSGIT